jgi:hypothetical protein
MQRTLEETAYPDFRRTVMFPRMVLGYAQPFRVLTTAGCYDGINGGIGFINLLMPTLNRLSNYLQ